MRGVLVNVGDPSLCDCLESWALRWIREEPRYRALGIGFHRDPEFETFTYGDYPWKPAKVNLGKVAAGDWIFFNETLIVRGEKLRFVIAAFHIEERVGGSELIESGLLEDRRYVNNAHVRRNLLIPGSDVRFVLWRGGAGSKLLSVPLLMDRRLIEQLGLLGQRGQPWDWEQHNRHGHKFTELQLIGFHTRATRALRDEQTDCLLDRLARLPARAELGDEE
ncbi:MAG: hypothetical protein HY534_00645 [Chloroflexi bacterium]|nr:hypothetical protein [Chloroflexota bacterium]